MNMRIKSIEFKNFHGQTRSITINDTFTYLNGANGRGKSTILQAMQLALLGYIPGYNKKIGDIFKHATDRQMSVKVSFDTGESIERVYTQTSKSVDVDVITEPKDFDIEGIVGSIELPIFNFSSLIDMTANQLKSWFINTLFSNDAKIEWGAELLSAVSNNNLSDPENIMHEILTYIEENNLNGVDDIPQISTYVKSMLSAKKAEATRLTSTLQTLVHYDDILPDRTVEDVRREYDEIKTIHNSILSNNAKQDKIQALKDKINSCTDVIHRTPIEYQRDIDHLIDEIAEIEKVYKDTHEEYGKMIDRGEDYCNQIVELKKLTGVCPITKQPCDQVKSNDDAIAELEAKVDEIKTSINKSAAQQRDMQKYIYDMKADLSTRQAQMSLYTDSLEKLEALDINPVESHLTIEDCISKEDALMDEIKRITANEAYADMHDKTLSDKYAVEMSVEVLKIFDKLMGPNGIASDKAAQKFNELALDMESTLSKIYGYPVNVDFDISDKANSFSFGITRDGKYVSYDMLSSGEKCLFTLTMLREFINRLNPDLKILVVDDLFDHLDTENLEKLTNYLLCENSIQCIVAGVVPCSKKCREAVIIV